MWVLMDLAPTIEEMYGSARYLFHLHRHGRLRIRGQRGYGHFSVGASGRCWA